MLFTDIRFLLFFVPVLLALLIHQRYCNERVWLRNAILLACSYWFYAQFSATYVVLLAGITLLNWVSGRLLLREKRKWLCGMTVAASLLPLILYKYAHFLVAEVLGVEDTSIGTWMLPVGISFFTFQALTYTIDIYRGKITNLAPFIDYALFVSFFPNVLSGPIEKARNMLPQLARPQRVSALGVLSGAQLFAWGLFKKIVVADRIAMYTDAVYLHPDFYSGNSNLLCILLYSIQIYADFSGYSDMAIGVARMIGFRLGDNFSFPYLSASVRQFWKRWHISLTSWFTEYLYIACGGNRVAKWRWFVNIAIVFLVSGLWHGAAWTFIVWGGLHALLYLIEHSCGLRHEGLSRVRLAAQCVYVFAVVSLAWVFFRASSLNEATLMIGGVFRGWNSLYIGASMVMFVLMLASLLVFVSCELMMKSGFVDLHTDRGALSWRNMLFLVGMLLCISLLGQSGASFVYFQF